MHRGVAGDKQLATRAVLERGLGVEALCGRRRQVGLLGGTGAQSKQNEAGDGKAGKLDHGAKSCGRDCRVLDSTAKRLALPAKTVNPSRTMIRGADTDPAGQTARRDDVAKRVFCLCGVGVKPSASTDT